MRSVASRVQQALVKRRTLHQGPLQDDLLSVLHHAVVLHAARLHVLRVRSKDQVAHPILKEIVDQALRDHPVHLKGKVVVVLVVLGQRVLLNGNVVLSVLIQGLPVLLGELPAHGAHKPNLRDNDNQVSPGRRAHPRGKVELVQVDPAQVVLLKDCRAGRPVLRKENGGLVRLEEGMSHLVVDLGRPALRKEEEGQVLDRGHLQEPDLVRGNLVVRQDAANRVHDVLVLHRESNSLVVVDQGRLVQIVG